MKKNIAIFLFIFFSFNVFSQRTIAPNIRKLKNDTVIWKQDSLLHKEDFKARGKSNGPLGYAATGIFMYPGESGGELLFYVEALFIKSKSYITQYSEYVLRHEQIHFDICELHARKLRQKMTNTNFKNVKNLQSETTKLYNKVSGELFKEQEKYDKDTEHGINSAKQKLWEEEIQNRIKELDEFSASSINIAK
ncbi:DUF922 domain-containing protein [Aurantibacillus circumpalustris]|uniref:DUF922 domain-containing protein n=1 Tax=Aurantibacillus circumpalustris TaxID=3036359 RepID=UPI00295BB41E|nr:DUF922 domain-containing protein [Aurantibacillus circumpalustris]